MANHTISLVWPPKGAILQKVPRWGAPAAFLALAGLHLGLIVSMIRTASNTFDETSHLVEGQLLLRTGDYKRINEHHFPLPKFAAALPFLALGVETPKLPDPIDTNRAGYDFLYSRPWNPAVPLALGRAAFLIFPLLLGAGIFLWARAMWGDGAALAGACAWAILPGFLANGGIVTLDVPLAAAVVWGLFALWSYGARPRPGRAARLGVCFGLGLACKAPALLLAPVIIGVILSRGQAWRGRLRDLGICGLAAFLVVAAFYRFIHVDLWFKAAFGNVAQFASNGYPVFFRGAVYPAGSRLFYLFSVLLKTPPAWILLALGGAAAAARRRDRELAPSLAFAGLLFLAATMSRTQAGNRYLLPAYAAACVWIGGLWLHRRTRPWLAIGLLLSALSVARMHPHYMAYASELVGPDRLRNFFVESDLDWGQDLPGLARWQAERPGARLTLCYFGLADVTRWGVRAQMLPIEPLGAIRNREFIHPDGAGREYLAMSATVLEKHSLRRLFVWDREPPDADIGHSILLWDITGRADVHRLLAAYYQAYGWREHARRELRQAELLMRSSVIAREQLPPRPAGIP